MCKTTGKQKPSSKTEISMNVQVYFMTPCGHIRYLESEPQPVCPLCTSDARYQRELAETLYNYNPRISAFQAADYAQRIINAESREDFIMMHQLLQEAIYGGECHAA
jgi:hypothetical protein